jgi:prephenate dehydratase
LKRIAIQGYEGSYHQRAANHYFNHQLDVLPAHTFQDLVKYAMDASKTEGAVMAIENSIAGSIMPNYTLLMESSLTIVGEIYVQIHHQLMALPGTKMADLTEVHSHYMAIQQCRNFFEIYPKIHLVETPDTALAAKDIAEKGLTNTAAIASISAAELYNLEILAKGIETVKNNYTRFLILSRDATSVEQPDKASVHFRVSHAPGSLLKALQVISDKGLNLSKIQSFPVIEEEWRYYFHCDLEFEQLSQLESALESLKGATEMLRVLGVYHKGETII